MCVCVCVGVCARARACVYVCVCSEGSEATVSSTCSPRPRCSVPKYRVLPQITLMLFVSKNPSKTAHVGTQRTTFAFAKNCENSYSFYA